MSLTPTDPSRSGDNFIPEQPMELDAQIERVSSLKRAFPESSSETSVKKTRHYSLQEVQNLVKVSQLVENFLADSNLMGIDPDQRRI